MKIELVEGGKAPKRMSDGAAGFDVFARRIVMHPAIGGDPAGFDLALGFKLDCSSPTVFGMTFAGLLLPRSGWGVKYGFRLRNTTGVIDPDYRGEVVMAASCNELPPELHMSLNETRDQPRVGQLLFVPCYVGDLAVVDRLDDTPRGAGGFGSTGA